MNRMRGKLHGVWFSGLFAAMLLTACGKETVPETGGDAVSAYNWKEQGFADNGQETEALLYAADYKRAEYQEPDGLMGKSLCVRPGEDAFYALDIFYTSAGDVRAFYRIGADGGTELSFAPETSVWGIEKGSVLKQDVTGNGEPVFFVGSAYGENADGIWEAGRFFAVYTDKEGKLSESLELTEKLRSEGIWAESTPKYGATDIVCDGAGNLYLWDTDSCRILLLDRSGEKIGECSYPASDSVPSVLRCDSGEVLFVTEQEKGQSFLWLSAEDGQQKSFFAENEAFVRKWYGLWENYVFYATDAELVRWDIETGNREILFRFAEYEISAPEAVTLAVTDGGISMLVTDQGKRYVLSLSEKKPESSGSLTVANISGDNSFLKGRVITFSREEPLYEVEYREAFGTAEETDRVLMEMVNGGGPDILYLPVEKLDELLENQALASPEGLLSEENKEALLPGVKAYGSRNGELWCLPLSFSVHTLLTDGAYLQNSTWTQEEVLQLAEENAALKSLFVTSFGQDDPYYNLYDLIGKDVSNSGYLHDGEAYFDTPAFQRLLRVVREKSGNVSAAGSLAELADMLKNGEILGISWTVFGMRDYGTLQEKLGADFRTAGYPTYAESGNYLVTQGVIAVNRNAADKPGVSEFLNMLFGEETQLRIRDEISVRKDVPEKLLRYDENRKHYYLAYPDGSNVELPDAEDKSSYLEAYLAFIESAVPAEEDTEDLFGLIMEEAQAYFSLDRSVEETTKLIQNRVQLYLDERK